jgi:hypothetical protein
MKNKIFSLFALSVFALVLLVSGVSAATLANWSLTSNPLAINVNANLTATDLVASGVIVGIPAFTSNGVNYTGWDGSFDLNNYYQVTLTPKTDFNAIINSISFSHITTSTTNINMVLSWSKTADFSSSTNLTLSGTTASTVQASSSATGLNINIAEGETLYLRLYGYGANAVGDTLDIENFNIQGTTSTNLPSEIVTSNSIGNISDTTLEVNKISFTNNGLSTGKTFGENGKWFPFENINADIQIKNVKDDSSDRINNIEVDWGLWDTAKQQWVIEMNNEKEFDLKDGSTKTLTVSFSINNKMDVDLSELSDGDHYKFYVTATGEVDNNTATKVSANDFKDATINIESDFVILNNFQVSSTVPCGKTSTVSADILNIGDQDQNNVSVRVYNPELGINQRVIVGDINAFDKVSLNFNLAIPVQMKSLILLISLYLMKIMEYTRIIIMMNLTLQFLL